MLLTNMKLYTNDAEHPFFEDGALLVYEGRIEAVGSRAALVQAHPLAEQVDMKGRLVMPGLINAHTHVYSAYARGMGVSKPTRDFIEILNNLWWALDKKLTLEDCRLNAYQTFIESIKCGVTTVFDHHASPYHIEGSLFALAEVAEQLGLRADLCYELSDRDGETVRDQGVAENIAIIEHCQKNPNPLLRAHFGLHASFTLGDDSLNMVAKAIQGRDVGIHCHVAEGLADALDCERQHGCRVVERLQRFGLINQQSMLIHLCHLHPRERDIMADAGVVAVHNPQSNMGNAVGRTPLLQLLERGILTGVGTDAYTTDMFVSAGAVKTLLSHSLADPTHGFSEALQLLMQGNPRIASRFFGQELGVLKAHAGADLIALDYLPYTPLNGDSMGGHILFGLSGRMCKDSMVAGRFIMREGRILGVEEEAIALRSRERAAEIWPQM